MTTIRRSLPEAGMIPVARMGAVLLVLLAAAQARGEQRVPPDSLARCDAPTRERLRYVEDRLNAGRVHADYWWKGFTGFYGVGTVVTSVQAATEDGRGNRAVDIVSATKAAFGTARLIAAPPHARRGSDDMRAIAPDSQEACERRLDVGERSLRQNAKEAGRRYSWKQHLGVVGINAAGAVVAGEGFGEREEAWTSAAIGIAIGEVMTFLHPWRTAEDVDEYESRFDGGPSRRKIQYDIYPAPGGGGIRLRF